MSDEEISEKFEKYGKVYEIQWEKSKIDDEIYIYNGIRFVSMNIMKISLKLFHRIFTFVMLKFGHTSNIRKIFVTNV